MLVPDRFWGGIIGALLAALLGALLTGYLLPGPGVPADNSPGLAAALWPVPGAIAALVVSYYCGARLDRKRGIERH